LTPDVFFLFLRFAVTCFLKLFQAARSAMFNKRTDHMQIVNTCTTNALWLTVIALGR
jgi:hypothetical protein